jgi:hypothetical protein
MLIYVVLLFYSYAHCSLSLLLGRHTRFFLQVAEGVVVGTAKVWQWFMISAMMHVDAYVHKQFL